ncbi:MAG: hypothetical protein Q9166_004525 [cf. Caloplaca sp. 2 TL-2023]
MRDAPIIEPIGTVTTWKGLTSSDCETLFFLQGYLKVCLEQMLQPQLTQLRARILKECGSTSPESFASADCMETPVAHRFRLRRAHLIKAMLEALYASTDYRGVEHDTSSKELLMLYLRAEEFLLELPTQDSKLTAIDVRFRCYRYPVLQTLTMKEPEVTRLPDYLSFERLNISPQEGDKIVIKPHYHTNARQELGGPHLKVEYELGSNHPWLYWDSDTGAFRGQVPYFSQSLGLHSDLGQVCRLDKQGSHAFIHLLRIEIKAFAVLAYVGSKVCLERRIRTRVTLRALPPRSNPLALAPPKRSLQSTNQCHGLVKHDVHLAPDLKKANGVSKSPPDTAESDSPLSPVYDPYRPGINTKDVTMIDPCSRPHQGEPIAGASQRSVAKETSRRPVIKCDKYDANAESLDAWHSTCGQKKRNDASRWNDAPVSPKARKAEKQPSSATMTGRLYRQPNVRPSEVREHHSIVQETLYSGPSDQTEDKEEKAKEKKMRANRDRYNSFNRRQDRMAKRSPIREEFRLIQDFSDKENIGASAQTIQNSKSSVLKPRIKRHGSSQAQSGSRYRRPPLTDNANIRDYETRPRHKVSKRPAPQAAEKGSAAVQPLPFSNYYDPLRKLSGKPCDDSLGDSSDSDPFFSRPAAPYTPTLRLDSGCFMGSTFPPVASSTTLIASIPLPRSPAKSDSDYEEGLDPRTRREQVALRRVFSSGQATEAFRQPGLSQEERVQIADALKMSVESNSSRSSSLLTPEEVYRMMTDMDNEDMQSEDVDMEEGCTKDEDPERQDSARGYDKDNADQKNGEGKERQEEKEAEEADNYRLLDTLL